MATLNMDGSYALTEENINTYVFESMGNYALGYTDENNTFCVQYVGRSDTNLNGRLKDYLDGGFKRFKFSHAKSIKEAYSKECKNYHDFNPDFNEIHPRKPDGLDFLQCPVCGQ